MSRQADKGEDGERGPSEDEGRTRTARAKGGEAQGSSRDHQRVGEKARTDRATRANKHNTLQNT